MKFNRTYTLEEISQIIDCQYIGDEKFPVTGMNEIHVVVPGDIVFVDHPKYYDKALQSAATIVLINKEVECPEGKALLISDDPFRDFNKLSNYFRPFQKASSSIAETARIGKSSVIQPNVFVGNHVVIGENCVIHPNVTLYDHTVIGNHVTIHAGSVLGGDAFYYKKRPEGFDQLISCGRVVIEDHVDIGAACTIDRGVTGDTTIGEGTKIDCQVQIGHDTVLGKKCLVAAQVGIAGCCVIEDEVTIWGQAGLVSGITVGKKAVILGKTGISKSIEGGKTYLGFIGGEARQINREYAAVRALPGLLEKLKNNFIK